MIYPLPQEELDDQTLDEQINTLAQTLCNVHHKILAKRYNNMAVQEFLQNHEKGWKGSTNIIPLAYLQNGEYDEWASECRANYNELVKMGLVCCGEYNYRFEEITYDEMGVTLIHIKVNEHKLRHVIEWAKDNVPDLQNECLDHKTCKYGEDCDYTEPTPFPLVMPDEYIVGYDLPRDPNYERMKFTIESYRDYYKARLQKVREVKCKECNGTGYNDSIEEYSLRCGLCDYGVIRQTPEPTWTRRTKPDWL